MKVLVAGATGFLGSHMVNYLVDRGYSVGALYRSQTKPVEYDTSSVEWLAYEPEKTNQLFASFKPEAVVNLAGSFEYQLDPISLKKVVDANLSLPLSLVSAMGNSSCGTFIQAGSYWQSIIGGGGGPLNSYTAAKNSFEMFAQLFCEQTEVNIVSLRIYDTYGKNDHRHKLLNSLLNASQSGELIDIKCRDRKIGYVHVSDICRAFELAMVQSVDGTLPEGFHVYFLPPERVLTLGQMVTLIEDTILQRKISGKMTHKPGPLDKIPTDVPVLPGWIPLINLTTGLGEFFQTAANLIEEHK